MSVRLRIVDGGDDLLGNRRTTGPVRAPFLFRPKGELCLPKENHTFFDLSLRKRIVVNSILVVT